MANDSSDDQTLNDLRRAPSARELGLRAELIQVRHELRSLLDELDRVAAPVVEPVQSAVVTSVVPRAAMLQQGPRRSDR
jgi:hypothetical protein